MLKRIASTQINLYKINSGYHKCYSTKITSEVYHKKADIYMDHLVEYLEDLGDEYQGEYDVLYSSGVLTLKLEKGTFVINKQPPNQQIWLSSPITGPKRFEYEELLEQWVDTKSKTNIKALLDDELSNLLNCPIQTPGSLAQ
jgi:frataxin